MVHCWNGRFTFLAQIKCPDALYRCVLDALIQTTTYVLFPAFAVGSDYAERLDFSLSVRSEIFFRVSDIPDVIF